MGCLTLLTEVTGQAMVEILVELSAVSPLQPSTQPKVRQLDVALEHPEQGTVSHSGPVVVPRSVCVSVCI